MCSTESAKTYQDKMFPGGQSAANMGIGNDKAFLIQLISQCLPFMGYPRSRNVLCCVNEAASL